MSGNYTGDSAWRKTRAAILDRDNYRCQLRYPGCSIQATQVDHIVPVLQGGDRLDPENLRAACVKCNVGRARRREAELVRHLLRTVSSPSSPSRQW